jgi:hypothetical protein
MAAAKATRDYDNGLIGGSPPSPQAAPALAWPRVRRTPLERVGRGGDADSRFTIRLAELRSKLSSKTRCAISVCKIGPTRAIF